MTEGRSHRAKREREREKKKKRRYDRKKDFEHQVNRVEADCRRFTLLLDKEESKKDRNRSE